VLTDVYVMFSLSPGAAGRKAERPGGRPQRNPLKHLAPGWFERP
jgi:hypothetical protein